MDAACVDCGRRDAELLQTAKSDISCTKYLKRIRILLGHAVWLHAREVILLESFSDQGKRKNYLTEKQKRVVCSIENRVIKRQNRNTFRY